MSLPNADRNLLLGLLALHFISREQLVAGFGIWLLDKRRALDQILLEQGALDERTQKLLEALTARHLELHGHDAQQSLAALSSVGSARDDLQRLADEELNNSLAHVSPALRQEDQFSTQIVSVGAASAAGTRFRILRPHAKGGLGQVSVALDEELHREVALKEIQAQHSHHEDSRSRFVREAEITGGLEHPGIVPVYGLGTYDDGRPFYAMRFIRGDSLKTALESFHTTDWSKSDVGERTFALRKLLGRFVDVCNAVAYAHSRGVLHRDLKPGNIMLGNFGETLVVDWGLAKAQADTAAAASETESPLKLSSGGSGETLPGKVIGTPRYMSPEQAAGRVEELGPATDVYSLGATLYHVIAGRPPFDGRDLGEILQRVQKGRFAPPREVDGAIPCPLEAICLKAMSLRPADRYATPKALAEDVERWLADEPVSAYAEPLFARLGRVGRRHRGAVRVGAWALVVVAVIASLAALRVSSLNGELRDTIAQRNDALAAAQAAATEAQSSVDFLQELFTTTDPLGLDAIDLEGRYYLNGSDMSPAQFVDEAVQRLDKLQLSPRSRAVLSATMGNAYRGLGQFERADPLLQEAVDVRRSFLQDDSRELALCQFNLANLRQDQGRFVEAEGLYRESIATLRTNHSEDLDTLASMQFCLGWTLSQRHGAGREERFAEAIALLHEVIELRTQLYTRQSRQVALTFAALSLIYRMAGRGSEEQEMLGQTRHIMETIDSDAVGDIYLQYIAAQGSRKLKLMDEAYALHRRAYEGAVRLVGKEHPASILLLADLASILKEKGEIDEAIALGNDVIEIMDRTPLRWLPIAADGLLDYARWLDEAGNELRAQECIQRALLIAQTIEHGPLIEKCQARMTELPAGLQTDAQ